MNGESAIGWIAVLSLIMLVLWVQIKLRTVTCSICGGEIKKRNANWSDEETPICDNCHRIMGDAS